MALLTLSLMSQLSQSGKLVNFQQVTRERNAMGTYDVTRNNIKRKHEIKDDMLGNLLNVESVRLMKRLGGKEKWHYRFLENGLVDVLGVSVSPDQKTITERYLTIEWGSYGAKQKQA